ncbi:unnamed protein product [Hymenolepis diminuta]|uniref:Guanylate cyclase n=1 Tax=Hymenolepis diminuta TaxID=6216 RepID=A0A158QG15_HYMDI|nr:unnamed protein product [Hymenolepis diminuta]
MSSSPRFLDLFIYILLPVLISSGYFWCLFFATPATSLSRNEIAQFYGLGKHVCNVPTDESVYRIAILAPFDPSLLDFSASPPQDKNLTLPFSSYLTNILFIPVKNAKVAGYLAPLLDLVLERIRDAPQFSNLPRLEFAWGDTMCDMKESLELMFRYLLDEPVHAFIGPVCTFPLANTARIIGARFRRPLVTFGGFEMELADKVTYPQLTRVGGNYASLNGALKSIFIYFGWQPRPHKNVALLHVQVDPATAELQGISKQIVSAAQSAYFAAKSILNEESLGDFKVEGILTQFQNEEDIRARMQQISSYGRIIILCADPQSVRDLMLVADELGYINGEYVFINVDLLRSVEEQRRPWYDENSSEEENKRARQAYRALLTITLRKPDNEEYRNFTREVQRRALEDYNYTYTGKTVNPFIGAFHDTVMLYALALKDTIDNGGSIYNGTMLTYYMRNRTFRGIAENVSIDENGDRTTDYSLLDMNPETGNYEVRNDPCAILNFEVVGHYSGTSKKYLALPSRTIDWVNEDNIPPPDTPRRARFNAEIRAMNWIISWELLDPENNRSRHHRVNKLGYVNQKSAAVSRGNTSDITSTLPLIPIANAHAATSPTPVTGSGEKTVVFGIDTPTITSPERQFLLSPDDDLDPDHSNPSPPPASCPISKVTFGSAPVQFDLKAQKKKSTHRGLFKDNSPPDTPMDDSWVVATSGGGSGGVSAWWKRQQRWSRKSDAPSQDDSNSGASGGGGGGGGGSSSGWMRWLEGTVGQGAVGQKRSVHDVVQQQHQGSAMSEKRRSRKFSSKRLSSHLKPKRKKSSFAWDSGFVNNKSARRSESIDSQDSLSSVNTLSEANDIKLDGQVFSSTTVYKGNVVALKFLPYHRIDLTKDLLKEVSRVKNLNYDHICHFVGACIEPQHLCLVYEYCPKGSLRDVLEDEQIKLDWMFKISLMQDVCRGMIYLHHNYGPHGKLKSPNCMVDSRFSLKITDFGLHQLRGPPPPPTDMKSYYKNQLWSAPELLRKYSNHGELLGTVKGDVYSFAVICQEIIYRKGVFYRPDISEPEAIVERVKSSPPFRPLLEVSSQEGKGCNPDLISLVQNAWSEDPSLRPEFTTIKMTIRKFNESGDTDNLLDNLLSRMEQYANNLEDLVAERTEQYLTEKKRVEDLLYSILPKSVASQLIRKQAVKAESFDSVTIYFSDIVEFTSLSADSTAIQIPHRPNRELKLRIGIHSGPVCAGVVGVKMPRYCLFGDTVNTSSRMETKRIHISRTTMSILRTFGNFIMSRRGLVEMKGKGKMETYWLHGEYGNIVYPPAPGAVLVDNDPNLVNEAPPSQPQLQPPAPPTSSCDNGSSCGDLTHAAMVATTNGVADGDQQPLITSATTTNVTQHMTTTAVNTGISPKNPPSPKSAAGTPTSSNFIRAT